MRNILLLTTLGISLLIAIIGLLIENLSHDFELSILGSDLFDYGVMIGGVVGFILMLVNGTFIKTKYFRLVKGFFAIMIVGIMLKFLHWSAYSDIIIVAGILMVIITYILSFLKKVSKKRLDYLKLIWVVTSYSTGILVLLHIVAQEYADFPYLILWIAIIDFVITGYRNKMFKREKYKKEY